MWNSILGALAILGMVFVLANAPKLVDAWCDRIRYGVQNPDVDLDDDGDEDEPAAKTAATAPVAKAAVKPTPAKPAAA